MAMVSIVDGNIAGSVRMTIGKYVPYYSVPAGTLESWQSEAG